MLKMNRAFRRKGEHGTLTPPGGDFIERDSCLSGTYQSLKASFLSRHSVAQRPLVSAVIGRAAGLVIHCNLIKRVRPNRELNQIVNLARDTDGKRFVVEVDKGNLIVNRLLNSARSPQRA